MRPLVTLSYAQTLDGSITEIQGTPTALSSPKSSEATHLIRAGHEAIMVGAGTVRSDNPRLTVRLVDGESPRPVVLDSRLQISPEVNLLKDNRRPIIVCSTDAPESAERRLSDCGAEVRRVPTDSGGELSLEHTLEFLVEAGIGTIMVEGGGQLITSFLMSGLWDRAAITVVPRWLGGYGPGYRRMSSLPLNRVHWLPCDPDVLCLGERAA